MQILSATELVRRCLTQQPAQHVQVGGHRGPVEQLGPALGEKVAQRLGSGKFPQRARRLRDDTRKNNGTRAKALKRLRSIRAQRVCPALARAGALRPDDGRDQIGVIRCTGGVYGERSSECQRIDPIRRSAQQNRIVGEKSAPGPDQPDGDGRFPGPGRSDEKKVVAARRAHAAGMKGEEPLLSKKCGDAGTPRIDAAAAADVRRSRVQSSPSRAHTGPPRGAATHRR